MAEPLSYDEHQSCGEQDPEDIQRHNNLCAFFRQASMCVGQGQVPEQKPLEKDGSEKSAAALNTEQARDWHGKFAASDAAFAASERAEEEGTTVAHARAAELHRAASAEALASAEKHVERIQELRHSHSVADAGVEYHAEEVRGLRKLSDEHQQFAAEHDRMAAELHQAVPLKWTGFVSRGRLARYDTAKGVLPHGAGTEADVQSPYHTYHGYYTMRKQSAKDAEATLSYMPFPGGGNPSVSSASRVDLAHGDPAELRSIAHEHHVGRSLAMTKSPAIPVGHLTPTDVGYKGEGS